MKIIKILNDAYGVNYLFILDCKYSEMIKYCRRFSGDKKFDLDPEGGKGCAGMFFTTEKKSDRFRTIWIEKFKSKRDYPNLCHELIHAVVDVFSERDVRINKTNDEPMAYYFQSILEKIINTK